MTVCSCLVVIVDAKGRNDTLVISLDVYGLHEKVAFGSSIVVDSSEDGVSEALNLPDGFFDSGNIEIQAGVGQLPSILAIAQQLYSQNM